MSVVEVASRGSAVHVEKGLLRVNGKLLSPSDLELILLHVPAVTITGDALCLLSENGVEVLVCDGKRQPTAMVCPILGSSFLASRLLRLQAGLRPRKCRALWRQIVRAKIGIQAQLLERRGHKGARLRRLASQTEDGDPANVEGQAARLYWQPLFGKDFRRHAKDDANALLDFGYAVMRATIARQIHAAGLHRALGIHHDNAENPGNLSDDLLEPYRPLVDQAVLRLLEDGSSMDAAARQSLAALGEWPARHGGEWVRARTSAAKLCQSLRQVIEGAPARLSLPESMGDDKDAGRMADDVAAGLL